MIEIHELYFKWLMKFLGDESSPFERLGWMLFQNVFQRRVGHDINRASDGKNLRREFLDDYSDADIDPRITNAFLAEEDCSWLEMLAALSRRLDFTYDGGVHERYLEMIDNLGLMRLLFETVPASGSNIYDEIDQDLVDAATSRVDYNHFGPAGDGGLFPLSKYDHPDQREVEIWAQCAAYFRERLEGMWTSTN